MSRLELRGRFWLPERVEEPVQGTLRVTKTRCTLELVGAFSALESSSAASNRYPIVFGELEESAPSPHPGTQVTLIGGFTTRLSRSLSTDKSRETLVANRAMIGDEVVSGPDHAFTSAQCAHPGLTRWMAVRPFEVDNTAKPGLPVVRPLAPQIRSVDLGGATLNFETVASLSMSRRRVAYSSRTSVVFTPATACSAAELSRRFLVPLRNLTTLVLGEFQPLTLVTYRLAESQPWPPVIHDISPRGKVRRTKAAERDRLILFPHDDVALGDLMRCWFELAARHPRTIGLVCGLIEAPPRFIEVRFKMTREALGLVATRVGGGTTTALVEGMPLVASALHPDPSRAVSEIERMNARLWDEELPYGPKLLHLTELMSWLIRARIAIAVGVSEEAIVASDPFERAAPWLRANFERDEKDAT